MKALLFISTISLSLFLSGCMGRYYSPNYGYRGTAGGVYSAPQYNEKVRTPRRGRVYNARVDVSGDISYVDKKYFKQTLNESLYKIGIEENYNSPNTIDIRIIKSVNESKTSGGDSYQNCTAFKVTQKVQGAVIYTVKGRGYYTNSINYKFIVNSASCVSYDDAELKARKKLFRRLGEITASKLVNIKSKLLRNGATCKINRNFRN